MSDKIVKLDLSNEVPTRRATVHFEKVKLRIKMPGWLGGATFDVTSQVLPGSPQNTAVTTLQLAIASSLIIGVVWLIGVPAMTALITGLCVPIGLYLLVHFTSGQHKQ